MQSLRKKSEFDLTYSKGKFCQNSLFRMIIFDRADIFESKVGFVVSKKYGKAVQRNRLKRIMRECWRALTKVPGGKNYILMPRHKLKDVKFEEARQALKNLMEQSD